MKKLELRQMIKEELKEISVADAASNYYDYKQYKKEDEEKLNKAIPLLQQVVRRKRSTRVITAAEAQRLENLILDIEKKLS